MICDTLTGASDDTTAAPALPSPLPSVANCRVALFWRHAPNAKKKVGENVTYPRSGFSALTRPGFPETLPTDKPPPMPANVAADERSVAGIDDSTNAGTLKLPLEARSVQIN